MRELGDQHAPDGDDSGADAVPGHAGDARQPGYEAVHDAAVRRASALEYRQRVEAAYAASNAEDAGPREARVDSVPAGHTPKAAGGTAGRDETGADPDERPAEPAADSGPADGAGAGGKARPGCGPDAPAGELPTTEPPAPENAMPPKEPEDSWPPPRADQDRVRKLYREYLADMASASPQSGRDQGMNAVGPKPDRSPGEISGLPPPGDKLTETEPSRKSRFNDLLREAEKEENLDGLHDAIEEDAGTVQRWLSARPPEGHAEQPVPVPHPHITPWVPEHGIEGGEAASAVLVAGILTIHMARWIDDRLRHGKGDHHDGNR